jgi:hypothetical protein
MIRDLWKWVLGIFFPKLTEEESHQSEENPPDGIREGERLVLPEESGKAETAELELPKKEDLLAGSQQSVSEIEQQEPKTSVRSESSGIHERWKVSHHPRSPFEKVGRLYLSGENLVIRSELDRRGFSMRLSDIEKVLDREVGIVYSIDGENQIGTAKLSVSGKGMNFTIKPFFYTTPLQSLTRMLDGEQRKAPLFVGREVVEG